MDGSPLLAVTLILLVGTVALAIDHRRTTRRLDELARRVSGWVGTRDPEPIGKVHEGGRWQRIGRALDALARSYEERARALESERPWRLQLVDALVEPALLFDATGRLQAANAAARRMTGLGADVTGLTIIESTASAGIAETAARVHRTQDPIVVDVERAGRDLRVSVSLIGEETLIVLTDRTRERQIEDLRRDFVVNASHELKTPVTAIQTLGDAIALTLPDDPIKAAGLMKRLNSESERLARLVGELLDLRRLEVAGPLERVPVDLAEVVRLVAAEQIPRAESRRIDIRVDLPERAPLVGVAADLEAVVKNLVSNAIKYNREGGRIEISLETRDANRVLRVSDTGIGIAQQDLPRVFERFYRVDTARSRATGGTGLGLSIVRHAVERHGGTVSVESTLGEGTTFTVTLPIDTQRDPLPAERHSAQPNRPEM
jgi:signal transduction histidine kinase